MPLDPSTINWNDPSVAAFCVANPSDRYCQLACSSDPHLAFCRSVVSFYHYWVSLPANATFLALFVASFLGFAGVYAFTRRGLGFTVAMLLGVACEIVGYVGRIMSHNNQWDENGFLIQIVCLTIGPAFMAAGVYLCLKRIVYAFGPANSRIRPEYYTRMFIPCDVISLVLQATGGGMATVASHKGRSVTTGNDITIAGLSFQVITSLVFIVCCLDFAVRSGRRYKQIGSAAFDQDAAAQRLRGSWTFKGFLFALGLTTICIFWRSVYRVAELSKGWDGPLQFKQGLFIGFEGVMMIIACAVLNVFHPSLCLREMMDGKGGIGSKKKAMRFQSMDVRDLKDEPVSDLEEQAL